MILLKQHNGFIAQSQSDFEALAKYKNGESYEVKIKKPRNLQFHKKFFALLNCTIYHMPESMERYFPNIYCLLDWLKLEAGIRETRYNPDGTIFFVPGSISFASMNEETFADFYNKCTTLILGHILSGIDQRTLEDEIIHFL